MIKFEVANPAVKIAPKNVLYLGETNTLQFIFSVDSGTTQFNQGDTIIIQAKTGLLTQADGVQLHSNADWDFSYKNTSTSDVFILTAQKEVDITPLAACTMELSGFQPANLSTNFTFGTQYVLGGRRQSGAATPIIILNPPENLQDLRTAISFSSFINDNQPSGQTHLPENILYLSLQDLNPPIANRIHLNLSYSGTTPLVSGWSGAVPQITLFFSYGTGDSDLTDAIQSDDQDPPQPYNALTTAWNIAAQILGSQATYWNLQPPKQNSGTAYPAWIITPKPGNQNLFTQNMHSFDLFFDHVISRLPTGVAILYVQWNHIPGYFDSAIALPLSKQTSSPQVLAFECSNMNQQTPEALNLSWSLFAANTVLLNWDAGLRSDQFSLPNPVPIPQLTYSGSDNSIVPDQPDTTLIYQPQNSQQQLGPKGSVEIIVKIFPKPTLSQFRGVYQQDAGDNWSILFTWLAQNLGGRYTYTLNNVALDLSKLQSAPYTPKGYPFSLLYPVTEAVVATNFSLVATDLVNQLSGRIAIAPDFPDQIVPQIISFTAVVRRDENGTKGIQFDGAVRLATDQSEFTVFSDAGVVQRPQPGSDGKISFFVPITAGNPAEPTYTLVVRNPIGTSATLNTALVNPGNI